MKRRNGILAVAVALVALLCTLIHVGINRGVWNIHVPKIEGATTRSAKPAAVAPPAPVVASNIPDGRLSGTADQRPASRATRVIAPPKPQERSPKDPEAAPPFWCFRTFNPGLPWMMNTDERNTGNAAHSDSEYVWNGERSLRMDIMQIGEDMKGSRSPRTQRNVLWQAIRAAPFRGKRIAFRPTLRSTPGGFITAFLRSWDGKTDAPGISPDLSDTAKTPTTDWRGAWGSPRLLLDVPMDAEIIYYGIVQSGAVPVWIDHVELERDTWPGVLGTSPNRMDRSFAGLPPLPIDPNWVWDKPRNLDFEIVYPDENAEPLEDTPPLPC